MTIQSPTSPASVIPDALRTLSPRPQAGIGPEFEERIAKAKAAVQSLKQYEQHGVRRTFHGFYYISHYYPLRAMAPVTAEHVEEVIKGLKGSSFETYIHFPFCEHLCTFCHFHKRAMGTRNYEAKEDDALSLVEAEMKMYHEVLGAKIDARSLQVGGGTPSLISNKRLAKLLKNVEQHMEIRQGAEIKIELYPKEYEEKDIREKLHILRDFGFTDMVIDLESGNQKTLDYINRRKSSLDAYLKLVDICIQEGHTSIITALMAGLPQETFESLDNTLQTLMKIPEVNVINVFPVIMRETDPISRQFLREPQYFHNAEVRDQMWVFARNTLRDKGYIEGPISYLHHPSVRPEQQADKFECVNLLGFGTSGFGYLNGPDWAAQYFNYCNGEEYAERIEQNQLAIWRLGRYGQDERARRKVIFGLANVKTENLFEIEKRFGVSIDAIYGKVFNAMLELGLIGIDQQGGGIYYTEAGLSRLEELTYFLSSDYVKDCCDKLPDYEDPNHQELISQHYFTTMPPEDRARFEALVARQPGEFMYRLKESPAV